MAKLFRRIWYDPVGSKVIASLILLILPSIIAYFVSLVTKNLLVVVIIGFIVFIIFLVSLLIYNKSNRIIINIGDRFISASCSGNRIDFVQNLLFSGKNKSNKPILHVSGFIRSNITNETYPVYFNVEGNLVLPVKTNGIPPKASFELVVPLLKDNNGEFLKGENGKWDPNHGLNLEAFLANLESSILKLEFDRKIYTYYISASQVRKNIELIQKEISFPIEPRVSHK